MGLPLLSGLRGILNGGLSTMLKSSILLSYNYFTNDAKTNRYFTDNAKTNKYSYHTTGTAKLSGETVVAVFGDSLEQHQMTGAINAGALELSYWSRSYMNWARMFDPRGRRVNWSDANVTNRLAKGFNNGISGNNTSQMAARTTNVTTIPGVKVCVVGGGTNDISTDTTSGNSAARYTLATQKLRSVYDDLLAAGIKIIIVSIPPRTLAQWASGSAARQLWMDLCTWAQAQADADPTRIKIVRRDLICSNADADRTPKTGYLQSDEVHLTPLGGAAVALDTAGLINALAVWVNPFTSFPDAVATGDIATNPTCTGTTGTASTGATGTVCTGMTMSRASGSTGVSVVCSKETVAGIDYQKFVFTADGTSTGGTNATFTLAKAGNITTPLPKAGTWLQGFLQFKADATPLIEGISLRPRGQPSTPANMDSQSMKSDTGLLWPNVAYQTASGGPLWQSTPQFQVKDGTTSILWNATMVINNQTAGTVTIWISRMQLIPILDPTIEF